MKKRKPVKPVAKRMHMVAKWEILSTAEMIIEKYPNQPIPESVLADIYVGNAVPFVLAGFISSQQKWGVTIVTTARDDAGGTHTHEVSWRIDEPLSFKDFMNGNPAVKVNRGSGLKTRWLGVGQEWIKMVDEEMAGLIAVEAWATANCLAELKTSNSSIHLASRHLTQSANSQQPVNHQRSAS